MNPIRLGNKILSVAAALFFVACVFYGQEAASRSYASADIDPASYNCTGTLGGGKVKLYWNITSDGVVDFALEIKAKGWVGFGTGARDEMEGADIMMASVKNGVLEIVDQFSPSNARPLDDLDYGGQYSFLRTAGKEENGVTSVKFARYLNTNDPRDTNLAAQIQKTNAIFAWHPTSDDLGDIHDEDDSYEAELSLAGCFLGEGSKGDGYSLSELAHGSLMLIAWAFLIPASQVMARFFKHIGHKWFIIHIVMASVALVFTCIGYGIMISEEGEIESLHGALGTVVLSLLLIQPFIGFYADKVYDAKRSEIPVWPDKVHWYIGRVAFVVSLVTISLGIAKTEDAAPWAAVFVLLMVGWVILSIILKKRGFDSHDPKGKAQGKYSNSEL